MLKRPLLSAGSKAKPSIKEQGETLKAPARRTTVEIFGTDLAAKRSLTTERWISALDARAS
jgi:hypothetical protein